MTRGSSVPSVIAYCINQLRELRGWIAPAAVKISSFMSEYVQFRSRRALIAARHPVVASKFDTIAQTSEPAGGEKSPAGIAPATLTPTAFSQTPTVFGQFTVAQGELRGNEDVPVEGRLEGSIRLEDQSLTIGLKGQVKAEIHARQVVIFGSVSGKISAREKIEIRKTGQVVGDLLAAAVAIDEGAYFEGSVDLRREGPPGQPRAVSAPSPLTSDE